MSARPPRPDTGNAVRGARNPLLILLAAVFALEALGLVVVLVLLVVGLAGAARGVDVASALALAALAVTGVLRSTFVVDPEGRLTLALYDVKASGHVASLRKKLGID